MKVGKLIEILSDIDKEEEICFLSYERWMYRGLLEDSNGEVPLSVWLDTVKEFEAWSTEELGIHEFIAETIMEFSELSNKTL